MFWRLRLGGSASLWDSKDPLMAAYRREVDVIAGHFKGYQVEHIDPRKNEAADALRWLGS